MKGASDRRKETYLHAFILAFAVEMRELVDSQWLEMFDSETSDRFGLVRLQNSLWSACRLALECVRLHAVRRLGRGMNVVLRMKVN